MRIIYVDLLFALNVGMDFLLLTLVGWIWSHPTRVWRRLLAAFLGGAWAILVTLNGQRQWFPDWLGTMLTLGAVSGGMIWQTFEVRGKRCLFYQMTLFGAAFLMSGAVDAVYDHTRLGAFVRDGVMNVGRPQASLKMLFIGAGLVSAGVALAVYLWRSEVGRMKTYQVRLAFRGQILEAEALYDTGNRLTDPVLGKPVHVLELAVAEALLSAEECYFLQHFLETEECPADFPLVHAIPYCSVGQPDGVMPAIFMDELWLLGDTPLHLARPLIGFSFHSLNQDHRYRMILHPEASWEQKSKKWEDRRL